MGWGAFDFRFGCARAREIFYFLFFSLWSCTIPSKKRKKEVWRNSGARADPKILPSQWRFSVGAQARGSQ